MHEQLLATLSDMIRAEWIEAHTCEIADNDDFIDCNLCQESSIFYQVLSDD